MEIRTLVDAGYDLWSVPCVGTTTSGVYAICPPNLISYEVGQKSLFADGPELDLTSTELTPSDTVILEAIMLDVTSKELIPTMTASVETVEEP
jgi:hypothetical protein